MPAPALASMRPVGQAGSMGQGGVQQGPPLPAPAAAGGAHAHAAPPPPSPEIQDDMDAAQAHRAELARMQGRVLELQARVALEVRMHACMHAGSTQDPRTALKSRVQSGLATLQS